MKTSQPKPLILDKKTALLKAESWCAYQERSQQEVRNKLYEWNLFPNEVEEVISELITTNFLNEERFAYAYTSGKFKIKKWGKIKIKQGLKLKKVPDKLIQKALNGIEMDDYLAVLLATAEKKSIALTEKDMLKKKFKLVTYLQGKGFENDLIFDVLKANNLPS
ncbi:regulatory protein RecX [Pedobacter insulae]|uniref:Regulatory protein RecX n=1 Tax=Pedobacter insulae TaxID=414048 RepID=A0A1I2VLX2_9SPHI|nr:regulatory protein RecX [Pedobacter insulae]SFG89247.1 regulatory protein [Pedobacter insulae]